jgi:hypothetical protein
MNEPASHRRHQPDKVNLRVILICAGALAGLAVVIHLGAWWLFRYLDAREARARPNLFPLAARERERAAPPAEPTPTPPDWNATRNLPLPREPQLEAIKHLEGRDRVRAAAPEQLDRYQWVNREKGIVQIPLAQAMDLIAERGLPPSRSSASVREMPSRANSGRSPKRRQP